MNEIEVAVVSGPVVCGETAFDCACSEPTGHDGPHSCTRDNCGGQWTGTMGGNDFLPVRFPGGGLL
jgi:hypothetical protein